MEDEVNYDSDDAYIRKLAGQLADMEDEDRQGNPNPDYAGTQTSYQDLINQSLAEPEPDFPPNIHDES